MSARALFFVVLVAVCAGAAFDPNRPFECDGKLWLSHGGEFSFVEFLGSTFNFQNIGTPNPFTPNSIGYNTQDDFIYGQNPATPGNFWKIDADYGVLDLGNAVNWEFSDHVGFFSGDFDPSGFYYVASAARDILYKIDVNFANPGLQVNNLRIVEKWNIDDYSSSDFSINPITGRLYAIAATPTAGCVAPWELDLAQCTGSSAFPGPGANCPAAAEYQEICNNTPVPYPSVGSGAVFFDSFGNFYAMHNSDGEISQWDVSVRPFRLIEIFSGDTIGGGDGASCPAPFTFTKDVNPRPPLAGAIVTYTFVISSPFFFPTPGLSFEDQLSGGVVFLPGTQTITGSPATFSFSFGNTHLDVTGMTLAGNSQIVVTVQAQLPAFTSAVYPNQATLTGVPIFSGGPTIVSDDPTTAAPGDTTVISVAYDYSDAPAPFPTAGHTEAVNNPTLGLLWDSELAPLASIGGTGDDSNNLADEDGVTVTPLVEGLAASVTLRAGPSYTGSADVQVWIDFTGTKDFTGPSDQVVAGLTLSSGSTATIPFTVPTGFAGPTFLRARITNIGTPPGPSGDAASGEVEDHEVFISCQTAPSTPCNCVMPHFTVTSPTFDSEQDMYTPIIVQWSQNSPPSSNLFPTDTQIRVDLLEVATHDVVQSYGVYSITSGFEAITPGPHGVLPGRYIMGVRGVTSNCFLGERPIEIDLVTGNPFY